MSKVQVISGNFPLYTFAKSPHVAIPTLCPCKMAKLCSGKCHIRWTQGGNGHARWMQGENTHILWELVTQCGHKMRMVTQGQNTQARWEMVTQGGCEVRLPMQGEMVTQGHARWMQCENAHSR